MIFYSFFELSRFHWLLELNNQTLGKKGVIEISLVGVIANKKRIKKKEISFFGRLMKVCLITRES